MIFNPAAGMLAGKLGESRLIYYCVDEYTAFTGVSNGLKEIEDALFRRADLVVVSAERLLRSKSPLNPQTHLIRHGTDWNHFRKAIEPGTTVPVELAALPKPIIGFHGLLADWVDYELIKKIAERFSKGSVVLIGGVAVDAKEKIKVLKNVPNIHFLGRKPYGDLPAFCKGIDVAINPFVINDLTLSANPLKVREYLAAGLPVVSTDIPEVRVLENCFIGVTHEDFIDKVETALVAPKPRAEISDQIKSDSWEAKIDELRSMMHRVTLSKSAN
jgi:glycosyltransferase involved in cell wall biosynthesis